MSNLVEGTVNLSTSEMSVVVHSKGAWISAISRPGEENLMAEKTWSSPPSPEDSGPYGSTSADFHAGYNGGFHFLFPNSGAGCEVMGTPLPFHGEAAQQDWRIIDRDPARVVMTTSTRLPFDITRTVTLQKARLRIDDHIHNTSPIPLPYIMGHHPVFPLTGDMSIDLPRGGVDVVELTGAGLDEATLRDAMSSGNFSPAGILDLCSSNPVQGLLSVAEMSAPWCALRSIRGVTSIAMCWDARAFPHLWIWIEKNGTGFPWFGRARFLGIEPQSVPRPYGLANAVEQKLHSQLGPGMTAHAWLEMFIFDDDGKPVTGVNESRGPG